MKDHRLNESVITPYLYKVVINCKCGARFVEYGHSKEEAIEYGNRILNAHLESPGLYPAIV